jgi:hypothetical protein
MGALAIFRSLIPGFGVAYFLLQFLGVEMRFLKGFSSRVRQVRGRRRGKIRCFWITHTSPFCTIGVNGISIRGRFQCCT